MVGQGPAVLVAGAGQWAVFFFLVLFSSRLSHFPFLMPHLEGRRLDILKYCGLGSYNQTVVVKLLPEACSLSTG